jgi:hypothetical protein
MDDDIALIRTSGLVLSDEETTQLILLRQHFARDRATLDAVHPGEVEPAITFRASTAAQDEEEATP